MKKISIYLIFNLFLLVSMWLIMLFHRLSSLILLLILLIIIINVVVSYYFYMRVKSERTWVNKIIEEKNWKDFIGNDEYDDERMNLVRIIINGYLKDIKREHSAQILDKQIQISALQSQINPHFLYNTMESIRGQALTEGSLQIARMAEALGAFFRYSIDQKGNFVTLQEEIDNVKNYILIQEYRFKNKFDFLINVDEEDSSIYDYHLPKLTIQPIVENAIYHGIETKGGKGIVSITINVTNERLLLTISDNGVGMSSETLESVNNKLKSSFSGSIDLESVNGTGIALINVHKRIQLIFGRQYGLQVYSTPNRGTDVEIVLPLVKNKSSLANYY